MSPRVSSSGSKLRGSDSKQRPTKKPTLTKDSKTAPGHVLNIDRDLIRDKGTPRESPRESLTLPSTNVTALVTPRRDGKRRDLRKDLYQASRMTSFRIDLSLLID